MLSAQEFADEAGLSVVTVRGLIRADRIAARKLGPVYIIDPAELDRFLDREDANEAIADEVDDDELDEID